MDDIQKSIVTLLQKSAERLREAKLPEELAAQLEQCATQVYQPCVVAVVGQVKAGKSTFINAFLGEDLAKVGTTETLRRADGIDHLEYYLLNHYLEQATLVDTPGMGAVIEEHQNRTAEFIHLE